MVDKQRRGRFLGLPYSWQRPRRGDLRRSAWDPDDERILISKRFGWGYNLNLHAVTKRFRRR